MKNLLTTFVIILLIASCSSPTEQKDQFPRRVGTFYLESADFADYIGTESLNKTLSRSVSSADTIYIEQPGDYDMELYYDDDIPNGFTIKLYTGIPEDSIDAVETTVKLPGAYPDSGDGFNNIAAMRVNKVGTAGNMVYNFEFDFRYHCEDVKNNNIIFTTKTDSGNTYNVINFKTNGFADAVETVAKCG